VGKILQPPQKGYFRYNSIFEQKTQETRCKRSFAEGFALLCIFTAMAKTHSQSRSKERLAAG
jgi:hypothetical protein